MKKLLISYLFILTISLPLAAVAQQTEEAKTIMDRVMNDLKNPTKSINAAAELSIKTIQPNGSWKDISYNDKTIAGWLPKEHLTNLANLVQTYTEKTSPNYGDEKLLGQITKAFQYWYDKDPKSKNWWHNEIATPQALGEMLIMMRYGKQPLNPKLEQKLIERMKRGDISKQAGANKTDIALHYFYRALLTNDDTLLKFSITQLFEPIKIVSNKEGIQVDYSYLQHGPQLQISSYGLVFITGVMKMASYVMGTSYALDEKKLALFSKYYRDSYLRSIRGSYTDFSVEGRGISRPNILNKKGERNRLLTAQLLDIQNSADWNAAIARTENKVDPGYKILPYHRQFWIGDYVQHSRSTYAFNVRMVSTRTKHTESGNNENLLGRYLADGATNIQLRGPEYYNIMPIWEWDKIPGVTSRDYKVDRPITQFWGVMGNNDFAGGASDGVYGASGYAMNYDSLQAKKAWFFFDQEVVCLGAGISSNATEPITTTINQCWLNGDVLTSANKNIDKGSVLTFKDKSATWILHDGVGYYFPQVTDLTLSTETQKGTWYQINNSFSKKEVSGDVFKLWLNHGSKPEKAKYTYIVLPGAKANELKNFKISDLQVVANTEEVQAVYHKSLDMLQAIFYQPGSILVADMEINTDKPCALLVRNLNGSQVWSIADPLHKEREINLSIKDLKTGKIKSLKAQLPQQEFAGSTVSIR